MARKDMPDIAAIDPKAAPANPLALLPAKPLPANRLKLICASSSDIGNRHAAVLPGGTKFASALDPAFWSNVASQLRIGDVVEIHTDERTFFGTVYVRDVTRTRAQVARLEFHEFGAPLQSNDASPYRIKHQGPHLKWVIERIADGKIVRDGFETTEEAQTAAKALERTISSKVA
jgi:hypothetical protein